MGALAIGVLNAVGVRNTAVGLPCTAAAIRKLEVTGACWVQNAATVAPMHNRWNMDAHTAQPDTAHIGVTFAGGCFSALRTQCRLLIGGCAA